MYSGWLRSQSVTRYRPEDERQRSDTCRHQYADPDGTANEEFLDVWFAYAQCSEGSRFGLAEEDKDRVELILMRDKEENGDS